MELTELNAEENKYWLTLHNFKINGTSTKGSASRVAMLSDMLVIVLYSSFMNIYIYRARERKREYYKVQAYALVWKLLLQIFVRAHTHARTHAHIYIYIYTHTLMKDEYI